MTRINVVAVDETAVSKHAFSWYLSNYHQAEDTVVIVHIHHSPLNLLGDSINASLNKSKALLRHYEQVCEQRNILHRIVLEEERQPPGEMIAAIAKEAHASVIVSGSRGLGAVKSVLHGSVSNHLLHHSHIPLLIIPQHL